MGRTDEQRFFDLLRVVGDCWEWTGCLTYNGYGTFTKDGGKTSIRAHRWAYEFMVAPIPNGLELDHLCRNRRCVNPWHLEPVTRAVNARRGIPYLNKEAC